MPSKKKKPLGTQKHDDDADQAKLEALRKKVAEAEEARRQAEAPEKRSSRRQRQLVRWDVDTDIRLLLAVQYVCNREGVKIPWKEVAETMGPKFTEGAVVQHLSKLRIRREEQDKPNPPPLRRAGNNYYKKEVNQQESLPIQKAASKSQSRSAKRRRRETSSECSTDDEYTVIKKHAESLKKSKASTSVAPKGRVKQEDANSEDSLKLVCADAPWLQDFKDDQEDDDSEISIKESTEAATEISQATTPDTKKSKIVKLKVSPERLADLDRQIGAPHDQVSPNMVYAGTHFAPFPQPYYPYMYPVSPAPPAAFAPFPYGNFPGTGHGGFSVQYPSSGPSPFDYANRSGSLTRDPGNDVKFDEFPGEGLGSNSLNFTTAYPEFDMPPEFQNQSGTENVPASYAGNEFEQTFSPESNELFVAPSEFANLGDVEAPRYFGYEGEETKEF